MRSPLFRILLPVLTALALTGCESLLSFEVRYDFETQVERCPLNVQLLTSLGFAEMKDLQLSQSEEFKNQGIAPGDLQSLVLETLTLTVTAPEDGDLSYLDRVSFFAEAEGQPRIKVAEKIGFAARVNTIPFQVTGAELVDYAAAPAFTITTEVEANGCPPSRQTLRADLGFQAVATVQGVKKFIEERK